MIFESKNQEYGAFQIRKKNTNRHIISLSISCTIFCLILILPHLIMTWKKPLQSNVGSVRVVSYLYMQPVRPDNDPEKISSVLMGQRKALRNTNKFTEPIIEKDENVVEQNELKTQNDLNESKSAVGTINYNKGTDSTLAAAPTSEDQVSGEGYEDIPYEIVEQPPQPEGGMSAFSWYISKNLKYPDLARRNKIEGKVFVTFIVDVDGSLINVKILKGIEGGCDEEALRVIRNAPKWIPGKQQNKPVRVQMILPLVFKLNS
jgi:protein TonB